jgi:hypothetical protein
MAANSEERSATSEEDQAKPTWRLCWWVQNQMHCDHHMKMIGHEIEDQESCQLRKALASS